MLLLKDRGRDGRILIGASHDCHVRVPGASGEVEIYASRDGQVRVRIDGLGEMNDASFKDEHPIVAGALVRALGITFSLHPWAPH